MLLPISSHDLTTATVFSWVQLILSSNLSRNFKLCCKARSLGTSPPPLNTSPGKKEKNKHKKQQQQHWLHISERIKHKVACMCFRAINASGPAYLSELLPVYTPSRKLHSSSDTCMLKIQQYKHKTFGFRTFFCLDPTFGIHSHKTLDTIQPCHLLKPN